MSGAPPPPSDSIPFEAALRGRPLSSAMPISSSTRDNTARVTAEFPPLPPPRHLHDSLNVEWERDPNPLRPLGNRGGVRGWHTTVKPGSSLLGDGSSNLRSDQTLERQTLEQSSVSYDKQKLSLFGGPNASTAGKRPSISFITGGSAPEPLVYARHSAPEEGTHQRDLHNQSSPSRDGWAEEYSMNSAPQTERRYTTRFDDSYHCNDSASEGNRVDDVRSRAALKRRASSPPRELRNGEHPSFSGSPDPFRRLVPTDSARESHTSKHHPSHSSWSSTSSNALRKSSLSSSSLGLPSIASSTTSYYNGSGNLSPMGQSPAFEPETMYTTASGPIQKSLSFPLRQPSVLSSPHHSREYSITSQGTASTPAAEGTPHSRTSSVAQLSSALPYTCECCPKKPKKFETREELRIHESEKQYSCQYCNNRFKNKNEAERHQNSLHLRRNSWSCAALSGAEAAFHPSASHLNDVCGYCGKDFPNPPRWDLRAEHLNHVHKFGECNQAKKFFRADHFRQHLKHSHAGTSGKWTNMLENACMKDEPPDQARERGAAAPSHPLSGEQREAFVSLMAPGGGADTQMRMSP